MRRFPDFEDPTIALGIMLPIEGEVAYIHSLDYPTDMGFRPGKIKVMPAIRRKEKKEKLDFGDIL